jgi:hypothetical protein
LIGVDRKSQAEGQNGAFDPKRTFSVIGSFSGARARMILSPTRVKGAEMFHAEVSRLIKFAEINLN